MDNAAPRSSRLALLPPGVALLLFALYSLAERHTLGEIGYPLDDSYIHLQFARELAGGGGLAFNPGELSTGSTSPLWTALLSIGFLVPSWAMAWPKLLGLLFLLATVAATGRLLELLGATPFYQRAGALLVAVTPWLLWSALSGMEILLFTSLLLWTMVFALEEEAPGAAPGLAAPFLAALAFLARPEGLLLIVLVLFCRAWRCERSDDGAPRVALRPLGGVLAALVPVALLVLPLLGFNAAVGGSPWPSTLAAKTVSDGSLLPNGRYLIAALSVLWDGSHLLLVFLGAGVLVLVLQAAQGRSSALLPFLFLFGLPLGYSLIASTKAPPPVGNFGRYLFPLLPLVVLLAVLGLQQALQPFREGLKLGRFRLPVVKLALVALVALQSVLALRGVSHYAQNLKNVADSDVAAARFLARYLPPDALIATQDIGAIKLLLPNPILDLAGIVTPGILPTLRSEGPDYWEERILGYMAEKKPDLMVAFADSYPALVRGRIGNFELVAAFEVEKNVTMAGDQLVILRTPWCRYPGVFPTAASPLPRP